MKKSLRLVGTITLLLAMYFLLQLVFILVAEVVELNIAVYAGEVSKEALKMIDDAQFLKENPIVASYVVDAQAWGLFFSTISMLFFLHFAGFYRLRKELLHSIAPRPLFTSTMLVLTSMFALNLFVQWFSLEDNLSDIFLGLSHKFVGVLGVALLAPLLEEVLFRGAIQGALMRFFGRPWPAIILSALLFGIIHMNPVQVVYAALLGIVLGWIYYRTGSLLSVIVGHILNNSLAVVTTLTLSPADEQAVANSAVGVAGFVFFALLSLCLAVKLNKEMQGR